MTEYGSEAAWLAHSARQMENAVMHLAAAARAATAELPYKFRLLRRHRNPACRYL